MVGVGSAIKQLRFAKMSTDDLQKKLNARLYRTVTLGQLTKKPKLSSSANSNTNGNGSRNGYELRFGKFEEEKEEKPNTHLARGNITLAPLQSSSVKYLTQEKPSHYANTLTEEKQNASTTSSSVISRDSPEYLTSPFSFIDHAIESVYTEEFVYLHPVGPYNLKIVNHAQLNPHHYYTMSRAGVTQFMGGETEFTALDQWEREYHLFQRIFNIPFFRRFTIWKIFYSWKKYIRRLKMKRASTVLIEQLYILSPQLQPSLLALRSLCVEVTNWQLFSLFSDSSLFVTLEEYITNQEACDAQVRELLHELDVAAKSIVGDACERDMAHFLVVNGFRSHSNSNRHAMNVGSPAGTREFDGVTKISHAERAAHRYKCRLLTKFIRLVDYLLADTLTTLTFDKTRLLQSAICKSWTNTSDEVAKSSPLICVDVEVSSPPSFALELNPSMTVWQGAINASIDSALHNSLQPPRLLSAPELFIYTKANTEEVGMEEDESNSLQTQVSEDPTFIALRYSLASGLADAFNHAEEYKNTLNVFRSMYSENENTDSLQFKDATVATFGKLLETYHSQIKQLELMPEEAAIGIVQVDSKILKSIFQPSPVHQLDVLSKLIPEVGREKCSALLTSLKDANSQLNKAPETVEDFVSLIAFLSTIHEREESDSDQMAFLTDIYALINSYQIDVPEDDIQNMETLTAERQTFQNSLVLSEANINANTDHFSKQLESEAPNLIQQCKRIAADCRIESLTEAESDIDEMIAYLEQKDSELSNLEEKVNNFLHSQEVLQIDVLSNDEFKDLRNELDGKLSVWNALRTWKEFGAQWTSSRFDAIDVDDINYQLTQISKVYSRAKRWMDNTPALNLLRERLSALKDSLPMVSDLRSTKLQKHHWDEICELLQHDIPNDPNFTLGSLLDLNAIEHKQEIAAISNKATQEFNLRGQLDYLVSIFTALDFPVVNHRDTKDIFILGTLDDILQTIDESTVAINGILASRYVAPMKELVEDWQRKITLLGDCIEEWSTCQRGWVYLDSIFSSADLIRQLPDEFNLFSKVDRAWKDLMRRTKELPNCIHGVNGTGLLDSLTQWNIVLEKIQKQLEAYLETRRKAFPRFYFLSNDELLKILANSKSVENIQPHLKKCFDNLHALEFMDRDIKAMISSEGEKVYLGPNLKVRGSAEAWLPALEAEMIKTLRRLMKKGVTEYVENERGDWILKNIGQVVSTATQIIWGNNVEMALMEDNPLAALAGLHHLQLEQLTHLTELICMPLSEIDRKKIVALITTDVHSRDVTATLYNEKVQSLSDFKWQQQLRFIWDIDADDCVVRQANAQFNYGFEYMGVTSRLVITPLTDRCWLTITGALHLRFGCSPSGPAGTGKTESTKDLAKALGQLCIVINCSEGMNYRSMGKLFSGLAQTGAWTCLDEFNRIDIEVLSVVAQQLLCIRQALVANATELAFEGTIIPIKPTFGCMITMNPGYQGRTELPDNLKVLFRPVSMMIPDYALIAEILLFAEGFSQAEQLSKKMVKLYKLCSEQLSQQDHYDFGMRAVKSVLVMAGSLRRSQPELDEAVALIRAMRDSNVPKFVADDLLLFEAIVGDLFPNMVIPESNNNGLVKAIISTLEDEGLQTVDKFVGKCQQLYETINVRFGVMIVGATGVGKSVNRQILSKALTRLHSEGVVHPTYVPIRMHDLNPKSISMAELYGSINPVSQEWTDGLGSNLIRSAMSDTSITRHWVCFDGPVDALWVENLNSCLDDNQTLCLVNGERMKLKPEMRLLFEVGDLSQASPATVSRCGMVYMSPSDLGIMPYVRSWLARQIKPTNDTDSSVGNNIMHQMSEACQNHLLSLFETSLPNGLAFIRSECTEPISTTDIGLVMTLCAFFQSLYTSENGVDCAEVFEVHRPVIDLLFAFSYCWAIGGGLDSASQTAFSKFAADQFPHIRYSSSLFEAYVDVREKCWKPWEAHVPTFSYNPQLPYSSILVPTVETVRYSALLDTLLSVDKPVFFTGSSGVGKSVLVNDWLNRSDVSAKFAALNIGFSAQSSARKTQETIEAKLVKYRKNALGAPSGKRVAIFVDDVNMPAVEQFGAQPPIELLRQLLDCGGFYDREKLLWKDILGTTLICAASPPGGGRSELTARFIRHFSILCMPSATTSVLKKIFGSITYEFLDAFKPTIARLGDAIVDASIELYTSICSHFLPTPAKSHYTFNMRDISKIFQGITMIQPQNCPQPEIMAKLWLNECSRSIADRLCTDTDIEWFNNRIIELLNSHFGLSWSTDLFHGDFEDTISERMTPFMFGDWFGNGERLYEMYQPDTSRPLSAVLNDCMEEYNNSQNLHQLNLVFFGDAVRHLSRIARILRQPRGNAMLIGVGGSGKQSLTRLAAYMLEMECATIEITKGYGYSEFQTDLKRICSLAGVAGKDTVFMLTDSQLINNRFLEDINNLLNNGDVPNLYDADEMNTLVEELGGILRGIGHPANGRDAIYAAYIERVKQHLHIVLCMSPIGDAFRSRCRLFPSLINCCTIDWYSAWPEDALRSVAERLLVDVELSIGIDNSMIASQFVSTHVSVKTAADRFGAELRRHIYTTPKSYIDLVNLFKLLLEETRTALTNQRTHLLNGLTKLKDTKLVVAELQTMLTNLQPVLAQKAIETTELLAAIEEDTKKADKVKAIVQEEEKQVNVQASEVKVIADEAQTELERAMPPLRNALKALDKLKKAEISEVKSMSNPPAGVVKTMEAVCILFGVTPDWENAKKVLANVNFLKQMKEFDKDHIPEKTVKKLAKYVTDPELTEERMSQVSKAGAAILQWVTAMVEYSEVAKFVAPKQARLDALNAELSQANEILRQKQEQLAEVVHNVETLRAKCEQTVDEKNSLDAKIKQASLRLVRAEKLTKGLAGEEIRWTADAERLEVRLANVTGNVLMAAAYVAYTGAFTGEYRAELVKKWLAEVKTANISVDENFSLAEVLSSPLEIQRWGVNGLPNDSVSIESGIIATRSNRWPLLIDPQEQGKKWIKAEHRGKLVCTRLNASDLMRLVENSITLGNPMLIEDIGEEINGSLDPVLLQTTYMKGNQKYIRLGENEVEWNDRFCLYLTTKLSNPHYLPEQQIKVTLLNFTVTRSGLEDQLLAEVVKSERSDIEEKRTKLVTMMARDRKQLKDIEDRILQLLSESAGNILDDEQLIDTLEESKFTSGVIEERVKESTQTAADISVIREQYRPVAVRATLIYFVITDLGGLDPMYQYSLAYYMRLFHICLKQSTPSSEIPVRLENISSYMTNLMFSNISRGLFIAHKLIFSFLLAVAIMRTNNSVTQMEWNALIRTLTSPKGTDEPLPSNSLPGLLTENQWKDLCAIEDWVPVMKGWTSSISGSRRNEWIAFINSREPQQETLPDPFETLSKTSPLVKLLVIKILRPEKLSFAFQDFVRTHLGETFTNFGSTSLEEVLADSDYSTPIVFVLSPGADPSTQLLRLAKENGMVEKIQLISLGQGQGEAAVKLIQSAQQRGEWVMLQNCHLAKSWMPTLEGLIETLSEIANVDANVDSFRSFGERINPAFRLWLTSMPCVYFPVAVLQKSLKITNEPPSGVKANLNRTWTTIVSNSNQASEPSQLMSPELHRLTYGLTMFHAIVTERRSFKSLGFNILYEFNDSDLETSISTLKLLLNEDANYIPFDALEFMCGQINYGGRVTDDHDRRCLMETLRRCVSPAILEADYSFSASGKYMLPNATTWQATINYVESLPDTAEPELFGLHDNANITVQRHRSATLLQAILNVSPREVGSAGGLSSDQIVAELAKSLEERLPGLLNIKQASATSVFRQANGSVASLSTVLLQEVERFNRLLSVIKRTLNELQRAIRGEVVMSMQLDAMFASLLNNTVPSLWKQYAYPSCKPLASWMIDLRNRIDFISNWLTVGPPNSYWLSGLFFPQGFITGVLQTFARKYVVPIDSLTVECKVLSVTDRDQLDHSCEDGVYIDGLYLEGARWNFETQALDEPLAGELHSRMPILHLLPVATAVEQQQEQSTSKENANTSTLKYSCPVYKTSLRAGVLSTTGQSTNYILSVDLPTTAPPENWILHGTALLSQLDD